MTVDPKQPLVVTVTAPATGDRASIESIDIREQYEKVLLEDSESEERTFMGTVFFLRKNYFLF